MNRQHSNNCATQLSERAFESNDLRNFKCHSSWKEFRWSTRQFSKAVESVRLNLSRFDVATAAQFSFRNVTKNLILELKWAKKTIIVNISILKHAQNMHKTGSSFLFFCTAGVGSTKLPYNHRASDGKQDQVITKNTRFFS